MLAALFTRLRARHWPPMLLVIGIFLLLLFQGLHFANALGYTAGTAWASRGRMMSENITPLAWCAYLMFLLGLLAVRDGGSWLWRHRFRFAVCWLWSVPAWCYFDWMNFYFMRDRQTGFRAWEYINLPSRFDNRVMGYLVAFGAIAPGMFLTAEVLQRQGFWRIQFARRRAGPAAAKTSKVTMLVPVCVLALGIFLAPIPVFVGTPASNLAIWVGTWALLDPVNYWCRRPSIVGDWLAGRFGGTLALGAGLICGFLWEFWNFWATTKWVYHLPFLGPLEHYKYFEMPAPGLIGFIAFGIETWAMWQFSLLLLGPLVEGERRADSDRALQEFGCF